MFLISHRIATIRKSDLILVLTKAAWCRWARMTRWPRRRLYRRVCAIQNELPQAVPKEARRNGTE
ncbi:MAG: hypothetical protein ACLRZH_09595 [Ruthenibacterium lactatiformans]